MLPYEVIVKVFPEDLVDLGKVRSPEVAVAVAVVLVKDVSNVLLKEIVAAVAAPCQQNSLSLCARTRSCRTQGAFPNAQ